MPGLQLLKHIAVQRLERINQGRTFDSRAYIRSEQYILDFIEATFGKDSEVKAHNVPIPDLLGHDLDLLSLP